ncbi:MAG: NAAT family transporter [Burkholderiales bacterium]|jgi:multiple antibiotic resistance protein|nr:NAAT family transporter [Burkholderiales bacterium]
MRDFIEIFLVIVIALVPVVNPLSAAPVFISMTRQLSSRGRNLMAKRVGINAFLLILCSLFIGRFVLLFFGLSVSIVQVGGGILVCAVAWDLLRQELPSVGGDENANTREERSIGKTSLAEAFYPLTLPVTVGPGSISVAITIGVNHTDNVQTLLTAAPSFVAGAAAVALVIYLCFRYAYQLLRLLGNTGAVIVARLFAFILLCIGVQITWNGIAALVKTLM